MLAPDSIFISYRRSDSQYITGRIYEHLARHFGAEVVFRDVHSIPLGRDYRLYLNQRLQICQAMIVVIGPDWLTAAHPDGRRRLDEPEDWVRVEVETGLNRDILVIPVLVDGARVPNEADLPGALKPLTNRNAARARPDPDFESDLERLIRQLELLVSDQNASMPLSRGQQLKLDYLKTKQEDLEKDLLLVQKELGVVIDVIIKGRLEKRQAMLFDDIDAVVQAIQTLEQGHD
ncbi:MAG: toll/interleukin-1 receptor domain-containing protein [Nodosilinea sp.]